MVTEPTGDTHNDHDAPPGCDPTWGPPSLNADVQGGDPTCSHSNTAKNPDGSEFGEGFYWICADCGAKGWYD